MAAQRTVALRAALTRRPLRAAMPAVAAARLRTLRMLHTAPVTSAAAGRSGLIMNRQAELPAPTAALSSPEAELLAGWQTRRSAIEAGDSDLLARLLATPKVDETGVFANTDVSLAEVEAWGFDFDYTVCTYTSALHPFLYDAALERLVANLNYPPALRNTLKYDRSFPARGIHFDPATGLLLKLDATARVEVAYYGRQRLSRDQIEAAFPMSHVRYDALANMRLVADLFCNAEICLLADVIDWFQRAGVSFHPAYVYADVMGSVSEVHRSGQFYRGVAAEPGKFVHAAPRLAPMLRRLRAAGKKLFLLTNSPWSYVDAVMQHMLPDVAEDGGWRGLFDVVIVSADKPGWYSSSRPFRRLYPQAGGRIDWSAVTRMPEPGISGSNVYVHGNLRAFAEHTGWRRVLYCGDHVEADSRDPRRLGWRTAVVLKELTHDCAVNNSEAYRHALAHLLELKDYLANLYACRRGVHPYARDVTRVQLMAEMDAVKDDMRRMFGTAFGSVLSSDTQSSLFGHRVGRFADLYTSRVDNFLAHEVDAFLYPRSTTKALPHEIRVVV